MSRPCECRRTGSGAYRPEWCYLCWLAANTREYGPAWGGELPADPQPIPKGATVKPRPCAHRGRELTGPERAAAGLGHARRWALCLHPEQPLGPHVCGCRGCGPACPGYSQAPAPGAKMSV